MTAHLHASKTITVIAEAQLENHLIQLAERHHLSGYTIMEARGKGASGTQTGTLDVESNITFLMIVSPNRVDKVMAEIAQWVAQGYHLVTFVSDAQVLRPHKFE